MFLKKVSESATTTLPTTVNQSQPTATTVTPTTAKLPTATTDTSSTTTTPTVQQLIDLVQEIKNVSEPASTPVCKQEQMASAASTTPVTKEDFETFKREMLQLSTRNSERFPPPSQSMPGTYTQKIRNVSETFKNSHLFFYLRSGSIIHYQYLSLHHPYLK